MIELNWGNSIITVLYRADSYLVIIHQFTSINWMELNVMILDWLERYKDEGNCDMKVYWMKWSMNVMKLTEWKQSDWKQTQLMSVSELKECGRASRHECWKQNEARREAFILFISHSFAETKANWEWNWMRIEGRLNGQLQYIQLIEWNQLKLIEIDWIH